MVAPLFPRPSLRGAGKVNRFERRASSRIETRATKRRVRPKLEDLGMSTPGVTQNNSIMPQKRKYQEGNLYLFAEWIPYWRFNLQVDAT